MLQFPPAVFENFPHFAPFSDVTNKVSQPPYHGNNSGVALPSPTLSQYWPVNRCRVTLRQADIAAADIELIICQEHDITIYYWGGKGVRKGS